MGLNMSLEEPLPKGQPDRHRKLWEQFISQLGSAIYTIKQTTFKLLKHMNQNIEESGSLIPGPRKTHFYIIIRNYGLISVFKEIIGC
jgi:hypothetical protein